MRRLIALFVWACCYGLLSAHCCFATPFAEAGDLGGSGERRGGAENGLSSSPAEIFGGAKTRGIVDKCLALVSGLPADHEPWPSPSRIAVNLGKPGVDSTLLCQEAANGRNLLNFDWTTDFHRGLPESDFFSLLEGTLGAQGITPVEDGQQISAMVPEPTTLALLLSGLIGVLTSRSRKKLATSR